jgi:hypothetical protein
MDKNELEQVQKLYEEFKLATDATEGKELPEDLEADAAIDKPGSGKQQQLLKALTNVFGKKKGQNALPEIIEEDY